MITTFLIVMAAAATPAAGEASKDPGAAMVCKKFPPPVGTRLGARRICKTSKEWELETAETRQDVEKIQTQGPGPLVD